MTEYLALGSLELEFKINPGPRDSTEVIDEVLLHVPIKREALEEGLQTLERLGAVVAADAGQIIYVSEESTDNSTN